MLQHTFVLSFFMRQGVLTEVKAFSNIVHAKIYLGDGIQVGVHPGCMAYSGLQMEIIASLTLLQAYADYQDIMVLTEDLIKSAAQAVTGGLEVEYQGQHLDFGQPFRRASMHDLVKEVTGDQHPASRLTA